MKFRSLYALAFRVFGQVRRRLRRIGSRRAAAQFAMRCETSGQPPGAILLLERLGDFVAASAVVHLVRERHPDLRLAWFGRARYREIALAVPGIDDYVAVDCYGELADVVAGLSGWRLFDLNLNGKSCACCGGSWRNLSGNTTVDTENYLDVGPLAAAFAAVAGIPWRPTAPALQPPAAPADQPVIDGDYALVHAESEESARNWHEHGFRQLVDQLLERTGLSVVHVGMRPATWLPAHPRIRDLGGATSQLGLIALAARCTLFVGIESSVAHLANVFVRPGLVLLGRYRRFVHYMPYTGSYGNGGAFLLRYASECAFLPHSVVARALDTVLRRLAAARPVGLGGPWDVRLHEIDDAEAARAARQDARRDVAAVLFVDAGEGESLDEWLAAWPGDRSDVVLAIDADWLQQRIAQRGVAEVLERLETCGARFAVHRQGPEPVPAAVLASHRCLRHRGESVVLGGGTDARLLELDATAQDRAAAGDCRWYRCDLRGRQAAASAAQLQRAHTLLAQDREQAPELPPEGTVLMPQPKALRASIDGVRRTPAGEVMQVSGWIVLESTGSPPSMCCLAEAVGDGSCVVRRTLPFSRLERPDVAAAFASRGALFTGMRIDVPPELRRLGSALAVLVADRETGGWQRLRLPSS